MLVLLQNKERGAKVAAATHGGWRRSSIRKQEFGDDPLALVRRIPPLLAQDRSQDRPAAQSRHLQVAGRGREARAGGAVLQAALSGIDPKMALGLPPSMRQMAWPCRFIVPPDAGRNGRTRGLCQVAQGPRHAGPHGHLHRLDGKRRVRQERQRPAAAGPAAAHVLDHPRGALLAGRRPARALVVAEGANPRLRPSCRRTFTGSAPTASAEQGSASD
jgi:hypothetical protein